MGTAVLGVWSSVDFFVRDNCHYFCYGSGKGLEEGMAEEYVMAVYFEPGVVSSPVNSTTKTPK